MAETPGTFGYNFSPNQSNQYRRSLNSPRQLGPFASQALQILSMRLPGFLGGAPIAPTGLLQPRVGGAGPDTALGNTLRQTAAQAPQAYNAPPPQQGNFPASVGIQNYQSPFAGAPGGQADTSAISSLIANALSGGGAPPPPSIGFGTGTPPPPVQGPQPEPPSTGAGFGQPFGQAPPSSSVGGGGGFGGLFGNLFGRGGGGQQA